jgi:hypothetical protein
MLRILSLFGIFVLFSFFEMDAQCAMCKENVASTQRDAAAGDISASYGGGLNTGILYLMIIPYLFLMSIVWIVFKTRIKASFSKLLPIKS